MNSRLGKRGGVGDFLVSFWATILIVIILMVFVIGSGLIREASKFDKDVAGAGVYIYDESLSGIDDVFSYSEEHKLFVEAKYLIAGGAEVDGALQESGYEK